MGCIVTQIPRGKWGKKERRAKRVLGLRHSAVSTGEKGRWGEGKRRAGECNMPSARKQRVQISNTEMSDEQVAARAHTTHRFIFYHLGYIESRRETGRIFAFGRRSGGPMTRLSAGNKSRGLL